MNSFNEFGHDSAPHFAYTPSETALTELRRTHGCDTSRWLRSLVDQAIERGGSSHEDHHRIEENDLQLMIKWIGRLFDEFELYTVEFNRDTAGTDLIISTSQPNLENTSVENDNFGAHLSTRFWTVAFAATSDIVHIYMIPAEHILAFTSNRLDERYRPFITIQANRQFNQYCWMIGNQAISWEMLPDLARELFGDLVNLASGRIDESDLYVLCPAPGQPFPKTTMETEFSTSKEPLRPEPGPALQTLFESAPFLSGTTATLSNDFLTACQSFGIVIDAQLRTLSLQLAGAQLETLSSTAETGSGTDLHRGVKWRQLTAELNALKMQLVATTAKFKSL